MLAFDCKGGFDTNGLTLSLSAGEWMPGGINYNAKVAQQEVVGGWKTVLVPLSKFLFLLPSLSAIEISAKVCRNDNRGRNCSF
jgi:hypothetical protein